MIGKTLRGLTATKLRLVLIASMLLLIILTTLAFLSFRQLLIDYSAEVNGDNLAANASSDEIARLEKLKGELENDRVAVTRAQKIVADSKSYQYQNQILSDITTYANSAGVTINGFAFNSSDSSSTPGATPTPLPTAQAVSTTLKSTEATISVESPTSYKSIMNFIYAIEQNLTRMQVTGVSIAKDPETNKVIVNPINIKVYTR